MHRVCSGSMGWKIPVAFFPGCCYNRLELNTQMVGAAVSLFCGAGGKRETGERPVRSRHCEPESTLHNAIAKVGRRGVAMTRKSGNLPAIGTGWKTPGSRGIGRAEHHCVMQ